MRFVAASESGDSARGARCVVRAVLVIVAMAALALLVFAAGCGGPMAEAQALEEQGDLNAAVAVYRDVLDEDPNDTGALSAAAVDLLLLELYDEAMVMQERLITLDPKDVQTRIELGFNYINHQSRPVDAVRVMSEAVGLDPTAKNLTFLAQAQTACGNATEAERTLRKAIDADPTYAYSYSKLVGLLELQGRAEEIEKVKAGAASHGVSISEPE